MIMMIKKCIVSFVVICFFVNRLKTYSQKVLPCDTLEPCINKMVFIVDSNSFKNLPLIVYSSDPDISFFIEQPRVKSFYPLTLLDEIPFDYVQEEILSPENCKLNQICCNSTKFVEVGDNVSLFRIHSDIITNTILLSQYKNYSYISKQIQYYSSQNYTITIGPNQQKMLTATTQDELLNNIFIIGQVQDSTILKVPLLIPEELYSPTFSCQTLCKMTSERCSRDFCKVVTVSQISNSANSIQSYNLSYQKQSKTLYRMKSEQQQSRTSFNLTLTIFDPKSQPRITNTFSENVILFSSKLIRTQQTQTIPVQFCLGLKLINPTKIISVASIKICNTQKIILYQNKLIFQQYETQILNFCSNQLVTQVIINSISHFFKYEQILKEVPNIGSSVPPTFYLVNNSLNSIINLDKCDDNSTTLKCKYWFWIIIGILSIIVNSIFVYVCQKIVTAFTNILKSKIK